MNNTEKLLKKPEELGLLWCTGITPAYLYENGKKTELIVGYKYELVAPDQGMMQFTVKVPGEKRFEVNENYVVVALVNSSFVPYVKNGRVAFSAKADGISIIV